VEFFGVLPVLGSDARCGANIAGNGHQKRSGATAGASGRLFAVVIRRLGHDDVEVVLAAADLFDDPPTREWTERFFSLPTHHLLFAFDDAGNAVGFVSGAELTHPDKGTEMFLNELGVAEHARRQGIGRALTEALADVARGRGCHGMWVGTENDNAAARRTYGSAGAGDPDPHVIFEWEFRS
jgi:ribosomal protein S18 acetylase RimI-like enzyme